MSRSSSSRYEDCRKTSGQNLTVVVASRPKRRSSALHAGAAVQLLDDGRKRAHHQGQRGASACEAAVRLVQRLTKGPLWDITNKLRNALGYPKTTGSDILSTGAPSPL